MSNEYVVRIIVDDNTNTIIVERVETVIAFSPIILAIHHDMYLKLSESV